MEVDALIVSVRYGTTYEESQYVIDEMENELIEEDEPAVVIVEFGSDISDEFAFGMVMNWHDSLVPDLSVVRYTGNMDACAAMLLAQHRYKELTSASTNHAS